MSLNNVKSIYEMINDYYFCLRKCLVLRRLLCASRQHCMKMVILIYILLIRLRAVAISSFFLHTIRARFK